MKKRNNQRIMLNWSIFMKTQRCENGKTEAGRTKTKKDTPYECDRIL